MAVTEQLQSYREQINLLDEEITTALGRRLNICKEVGFFKKAHGIAMMQPDRVDAVKDRCAEMGMAHGLRPDFMRSLYDLIIGEACELETEIMEGEA